MEEGTSTNLGESTVSELIGPFLADIGVDVPEVCNRIVKSLHTNSSKVSQNGMTPSITPSPPCKQTDGHLSTESTILKKPFNVGSFLNEAQSGFIDPYLGLQVSGLKKYYQNL